MLKRNLQLIKNGTAFHTCCLLNGQSAKALHKVMGGKKKKYYQTVEPTLPNTSYISAKTSIATKITGNPRRSLVLNKLFMKHITDLMATGEYSSQIVGYGIEVNKVSITQDYRDLRVYWIAKNSVDHASIEKTLLLNAGFLRNELSQLRLMGKVPKIVFVKDKSYWQVAEVERRLANADFGEGYEKPKRIEKLPSFELWTSLNSDVKNKLEKLESASENDVEDDLKFPPMPQNVLGLNHADILKNIKKRTVTSKAEHRNQNDSLVENVWAQWNEFKLNQPVNADPVTYGSQQEQRQAFKDFWQQRQFVKMKQQKKDKNREMLLIKEDMQDGHLEYLEASKEVYVDDYVYEDFDEYEK